MRSEIGHLLETNAYPGRGILLGKSADGVHWVVAYFIMGRSENSRNRIFVTHGEGIRTQAFDPARLTDPSLIIYHPVRVLHTPGDMVTIVTNGDQTDTIYQGLERGVSLEDALRTRTFEPDAPNYTPRISGVLTRTGYGLSILKSAGGDPESTQRFFYEYNSPISGEGHFIHTYRCDGDPLPSFAGEPVAVGLSGDIETFTTRLWECLNEENRVSLFVRYIHGKTGETETRIVNQNR